MGFVIKCLIASVLVLHGIGVEAASMRNTGHRVVKRNTGAACVSSCSGRTDGDYQSCTTCAGFVTCSNGQLFERPCPPGLVWDDSSLTCNAGSATCTETTLEDPCISSCTGVADGDYQSCIGCNVYASCSNGFLYDNRPCPSSLVWDDNIKRCEYQSDTCPS